MDESIPLGRRAVLAGGCGAVCAVALTACATYDYGSRAPAAAPPPPPPPDPAGGGSGGGSGGGGAPPLVAVADVPVGGGVVLAAQNLVVTQPQAGTFKAFDAACTHQGCAVNEVADGTINCPCHGSRFAVSDGAPTEGPATQPLPERTVAVQGSSIVLA
jgi:nitrite reductase/ring-hydroxylating ferredoxin subunit